MQKKHLKAGFLGFLVALAGAYAAYVSRDDDPRATEFAKYIRADIDAMASRYMTDAEMQRLIKFYKEDPAGYDSWLHELVADSIRNNELLLQSVKVIHKMDSVAGHELSFSEAMQRISDMRDNGVAGPSPEVFLKRHIDNMRFNDGVLACARIAKKTAKNGK